MMMKRTVLVLVAATTWACGESTEPPSPVASVALPLDSLNTVPGAVIHLRASVRDAANAPLPNEPVRWSSTDTAIATVDTTGLVTAKTSGSARIVARSGARADTLLLRLGLITFTTVAIGDYHACGLAPSGAAYCWGWGGSGELGIGDTMSVSAPVKVLSALTFSQIAPGYRHSCALTTAGAVYCWGSNDIGQVGIGARDTVPHLYPEPISGGGTYSALNAGDFHSCALTSTGAASCWGYGHYGQLGNGDTVSVNATPVAMAGGLTFLSLSGGQVHSCGIAADSAGYCWGLPDGGRLGSPPCGSSLCNASPQPASGGLKFIDISVGEVHSCGVAAGGAAWCWGGIPGVVSGGQVFDRIAAGTYHTCAITSGGSGYCWGDNGGGQLGDGTLQSSTAPVPLAGGLAFDAISAATNYSCGVTTAGTAYCWGTDLFGYGVLGVGGIPQTVMRNVPTKVLGQP